MLASAWALEAVASHTMDVPVVYAMVVNPPSIVKAGANITGASMNVPVEQSILLFKQLSPQVRRVGMLYSPAKTGYLVRDAEAVAREHGLQLVFDDTGTLARVGPYDGHVTLAAAHADTGSLGIVFG